MRTRLVSLLLGSVLLASVMTSSTVARTSAAAPATPRAVVASFFAAFSDILHGASLSELARVYSPTATFIVSTTTGKTTVYQGLPAIDGWYKAFAASHAGWDLKPVSDSSPLPGMVVHYEVALNTAHIIKGRCAHIFAVVNGMIVRDDFIGYAGA